MLPFSPLLFPVVVFLTIPSLGLISPSSSTPIDLHPRQTHSTLTECLAASSVPIITPTDTTYPTSTSPFNLRLPWQPILVTIPSTVSHISSAVLCANTYNIKVTPRGGGHSYGAMGLGGVNGSMTVDMRRFNAVTVDTATQIASVGAGVRLGNMATALYEAGQRAVPHGLCPGVGVAGHALHGGFGFTSRMWGTTLDNIIELDVVLANGTAVKASSTKNPDLFFALRGAGSSFGIVTTLHLKTYPAPPTSISFTVSFPNTTTTAGKVSAFLAIQKYGLIAPKEISLRMFANSGSISITGMYWGNRTNLDNAIQPLKDLGATVSVGQSRAWIPTLQSLANGKALVQPENYNQHETFFAKSLVTYADELLNSKQLTSFFTYLSTTGRSAPTSWWTLADLYGGYNSTITSQSATSTSYVHRNSLFTFQLYAHTATQRPPFPAAGIQFMNGMVESITGTWEGKKLLSYANYNDPSLGREEALGVYYGAGEVLERLKRVKRVVDPEERFWNPQSVPVA